MELDLLEEKMNKPELRSAVYKQRSARYYNQNAHTRKF